MSSEEKIREPIIEMEIKLSEVDDSLESIIDLATNIRKPRVLFWKNEEVQHAIEEIKGLTARLASDYERMSQLHKKLTSQNY